MSNPAAGDTARRVTVSVAGHGVVGRRLQRNLSASSQIEVVPRDLSGRVVVLTTPEPHGKMAGDLLAAGTHVVSTTGSLGDVRSLIDLDDAARSGGAALVVGAAVSPGLSGLLARHLQRQLARCDELHVSVHGTAGPACAREHHRALAGWALGWNDGNRIERAAGSGRELCWFPEPVGAMDCYRAELSDPLLLHRSFADVERISARQSATRRDRLTARLPMLSPPHAEGGIGALRVEARGEEASGARATPVMGVAELLGTATAAVAAAMVGEIVRRMAADRHRSGVITTSDADIDLPQVLRDVVRHGVRLQSFTGVPTAP
ncbi:hypothetical protein BH24ACT5_BH24ACT5_01140 [soil metagenome]